MINLRRVIAQLCGPPRRPRRFTVCFECTVLVFTAHGFTDFPSPLSSTLFPAAAGTADNKQALIKPTVNTRPAPNSRQTESLATCEHGGSIWQQTCQMLPSGAPGDGWQETRLLYKCCSVSAGLFLFTCAFTSNNIRENHYTWH